MPRTSPTRTSSASPKWCTHVPQATSSTPSSCSVESGWSAGEPAARSFTPAL